MDRGAWRSAVREFAELDTTRATEHTCTFSECALCFLGLML